MRSNETHTVSENQSKATPSGDDFYRRLCENASVALIATDGEFRIVSWNAAAERLLDRPAEEMLSRPLRCAVPENRRKLLDRLLTRTTRRGVASQFEVQITGRDGTIRDLIILLSPIPAGEGEGHNCGVAAWIVDETHAKRLAERLSQAEKIASLGTLAGGVAHHFNNIFGGVATFVEIALDSGDPASMKRALSMTAQAARRAAKITESLLRFARSSDHETNFSDLTEVVLTFANLSERPLGERHIDLQLDLKPVPVLQVETRRMHQVLRNLLLNAEEAMPNGGVVRIGMDRDGGEVVLTFSDTGCGIAPENLPMIFEPFFTTKGVHAGGEQINPGLGLSVVHGYVLEMGGKIDVDSTTGEGTTFSIRLPIRNAV